MQTLDAGTDRAELVEEMPVLIVGGSLIGLATALCLSAHGVRCMVVERHRGTAIHPRAGYFQLRTLELMRSLGIEMKVRAASEEQFDPDGGLNAVETLAGREIANYIPNINAGVGDLSPTVRLFMTQHKLEPILRERAKELGADLSYATELTGFNQDLDGVTATIRDIDSGATRTIRAQYLVACDGNRSPIREKLGIAMQGYGVLSHSITIYFKADCSAALRGRNLGVIYVDNPNVRGFFRLEKTGLGGFLVVFTAGDIARPHARNVADGITNEIAIQLVRDSVGDQDLAVDIGDIATWHAVADVAERFREGRIFLAGDAAHTMPPTGGFGGNTGIADAQNIGWKLAYVLKGLAGPELLDTYNAERQPVGKLAIEQAYQRYVVRCDPNLGLDGVKPPVPDLHIEIGNRYRSSAVVATLGDDDGAPHTDPRLSKALPGTRAPHLVLERNGEALSTLDLFGTSFVLLTGPDGAAWEARAQAAAAKTKLEIATYRLNGTGDICDPGNAFATAYGITRDGAVLVRPDGYVAWRAYDATEANDTALASALANVLDRRELKYA